MRTSSINHRDLMILRKHKNNEIGHVEDELRSKEFQRRGHHAAAWGRCLPDRRPVFLSAAEAVGEQSR